VELVEPRDSLLLRCSGSSLAFPGYQAVWLSRPLAAVHTEGQDAEADGVAGSDAEEGGGSSDDSSSSSSGSSGSSSTMNKLLNKLHIGQKVQLLQVWLNLSCSSTPQRAVLSLHLPVLFRCYGTLPRVHMYMSVAAAAVSGACRKASSLWVVGSPLPVTFSQDSSAVIPAAAGAASATLHRAATTL